MTVPNERADRFRELVAADEILVIPGVTDALTARVAVSCGFEAVYVGGYVMGQVLGMTEPLMTATETIGHVAHIVEAVDVPVVVDGNAGFGDLLHCRRNVEAFAKAGVAAVHVEDQVYPKRARYFEGHTYVVERGHAIEKIRAAASAREERDIVVIGRTDAREAQGGGLDEALDRVAAFLANGAEVAMPYATCAPSLDEAAEVARRVPGPTLYVASEGKQEHADLDAATLQEQGWSAVIFNLSALLTAVHAVEGMFEHLRQHGRSGLGREEAAAIRARAEALSGLPAMYDVERRSMPAPPGSLDASGGGGDRP